MAVQKCTFLRIEDGKWLPFWKLSNAISPSLDATNRKWYSYTVCLIAAIVMTFSNAIFLHLHFYFSISYGGIINKHFTTYLLLNLSVNEFWKSVKIWLSYWHEFGVSLFIGHRVRVYTSRILGVHYVSCVETFTATSGGECEQLAITWLCRVAFRPCGDLDLDLVTVRPLCRHQCEMLQGRQCRRVFELVKRLLLTGQWQPNF